MKAPLTRQEPSSTNAAVRRGKEIEEPASFTPRNSASAALVELQDLADQSTAAAQMSTVQRRADERSSQRGDVVQAFGMGDILGLPGKAWSWAFGGAGTEATAEPATRDEAAVREEQDELEGEGAVVVAEERGSDTDLDPELSKGAGKAEAPDEIPALDADAGEPARGKNWRKNQKKREKAKAKKLATAAEASSGSEREGESAPMPKLPSTAKKKKKKKKEFDDTGWTKVGPSDRTRSPAAEAARQQRQLAAVAVAANRFLRQWTESPDTSGTLGMQGEGSKRAHDLEASGKASAKAGHVKDAITDLEAAIKERKADPNQLKNPDEGHTRAIRFLERLIGELKGL